MKNFALIALVIIAFAACKKSDGGTSVSNTDAALYGYWRVDSITNIEGGNARTVLMDTAYGPKINPKAQIIIQLSEDGKASIPPAYHYAVNGVWVSNSPTEISFKLREEVDFALRKKSDWQPLVVDAFNNTRTYKMEGNGSKSSQLFLYFANGGAIVRCTKI